MLELVTAVQFIKRMGSGRNKPLLFGCELPNTAGLIEIVAKFSAPQCGVGGIIRESIGAMLAADLKLPVPRPCLVILEAGLPAAMDMVPQETLDSIAASRAPTFGCELVAGGQSTFSSARKIAPKSELEAAEIFAFDALVLNADRRIGNPNLLYDGHRFVMLDHELALNCLGIGGVLNPAPWQPGGLAHLTCGESEHVLYRRLLHARPNLDRLKTAWSAVTQARLDEYRAALPHEWADHDEVVEEIVDYLDQLRANLDAAFGEVKRVLE